MKCDVFRCRVYCEDTVNKCQCDIRNIMKQLDAENSLNHGGRFEWVDSVLVQCLRDGDWLLIENVNFCRFVCNLQLSLTTQVYF